VAEAPIDEPEKIIELVNYGFKLTTSPIMRKFIEEMQIDLEVDWFRMYNWIVQQVGMRGTPIVKYLARQDKVSRKADHFYIKNCCI